MNRLFLSLSKVIPFSLIVFYPFSSRILLICLHYAIQIVYITKIDDLFIFSALSCLWFFIFSVISFPF